MPYDPTAAELDRLQKEIERLRNDHRDEVAKRQRAELSMTMTLGSAAVIAVAAFCALLVAIVALRRRLDELCGIG